MGSNGSLLTKDDMAQTDDIKQRIDLVDLVQGYVKLNQAGTNWKARCPFHNEKTPSFMVSREKQIWHCFGCGRGGDAFSFIQEIEGMDFPETLRFLAERAGVELTRDDPKLRTQKTLAFDVNAFAAKVYNRILLEHEKAQLARDYCARRKLSPETIETWQLGYAPESWEGVSKFLKSHGFSDEDIFRAGLTVKRDRGIGFYDRFRNRIMFPIHDHLGRCVGFGGRVLADDQEPKYLNTPQTAIYDKRSLLYGFHRAKHAIKQKDKAVVVEGYMDVLASHQSGVENVVGSSGTALTTDQVRLLKRLTPTIALAFDTDIAGQAAALRGIETAWEEEMNVLVVHLPSGKDPDELIRSDPETWQQATDAAKPFLEYVLDRVRTTMNLTAVDGKKQAAKLMLPLLARVKDQIEQTHYLQELAALLHVTEDLLRGRLPVQGALVRPVRPREKPDPARLAPHRAQRLAERVLALSVQNQAHLEYLIDHLEPEMLAKTSLLGLYKAIVTYYTENHALNQRDFFQSLGREDPELSQLANVIFLLGTSDLLPTDERLQKQELLEGLTVLKQLALHDALTSVQAELASAERDGKRDQALSLTEKANELAQQLSELAS